MFYVTYLTAELRRRKARTLLTALGLAVGVAVVVAVNALATGLDRAQDEVLAPLAGVGTDMSVSRPIEVAAGPDGGPPQLSEEELSQLREENGSARVGLRGLEPGSEISRDSFLSPAQLSFPATRVAEIAALPGVSETAGALTLNALHVEGTVPENPRTALFDGPAASGPESLDFSTRTVTGVDVARPALAAVTPERLVAGEYFASGSAREAILDVGYARRESLEPGDEVALGEETFVVVGLAETPLGGRSPDLYVPLGPLQELSGRAGRVNTVQVRATGAEVVEDVEASIESSFAGADVTTASELADRVSGSLLDARRLAGRLGTALAVVGLLAAFLIAVLLTLSSVTKRIASSGR